MQWYLNMFYALMKYIQACCIQNSLLNPYFLGDVFSRPKKEVVHWINNEHVYVVVQKNGIQFLILYVLSWSRSYTLTIH